jgi:hypothetical protein
LDWPPPAPEGATEVPDVFTWSGPPVFAETRLPLKINITEIAKSDRAFDMAFIGVSLVCGSAAYLLFTP